MTARCFACDRPLGYARTRAITSDGQVVWIGKSCFRHVRQNGAAGWQPPTGGPKLYQATLQQLTDHSERTIR